MKKMEYKEYVQRLNELAKARRIFMPHITKNVNEAFELYQELFAEEKLDIFISTAATGGRPMTPMDDYIRPQCPECNVDMRLKIGTKDQDGKIWPTAWFCEKCLAEYYSDKTPVEWMKELPHGNGDIQK